MPLHGLCPPGNYSGNAAAFRFFVFPVTSSSTALPGKRFNGDRCRFTPNSRTEEEEDNHSGGAHRSALTTQGHRR